jgi:hypothetical protein
MWVANPWEREPNIPRDPELAGYRGVRSWHHLHPHPTQPLRAQQIQKVYFWEPLASNESNEDDALRFRLVQHLP